MIPFRSVRASLLPRFYSGRVSAESITEAVCPVVRHRYTGKRTTSCATGQSKPNRFQLSGSALN